jgi:hypothetical protein
MEPKKLLARYRVLKEAVADVKRHHATEAKAAANIRYALQEQECAMKQFPGKSVGEALALFHKTDLGKRIQKDALAESYAEMQLENALGNAGEINKIRPSRAVSDGAARARKCEGLIKEFMAKGDSYDVAASKAHRQERDEAALSSADAEGDQQRYNSGSWRNPMHENINPIAADASAHLPTALGNRSR